MTLLNDRAKSNTTGLMASFGGTLYFANCLVTNNTTAYDVASGDIMSGTNPGTNLITPGQGTAGTLSTPITLR